mmetsp:Transcript_10347/g.21272  ORF Transcript_10347/g.21272 Transcript_10347/m.21272 type:complete len:760 (-) Transcript_10347:287-2566(-)
MRTDGSSENQQGAAESPPAINNELPELRSDADDEFWAVNQQIPFVPHRREKKSRRNSANASMGDISVDDSVTKHSHTETSYSTKSSHLKLEQIKWTKRSSDTASVVTTDYQTRKSMWSSLVKDDRVWNDDYDNKSRRFGNLLITMRVTLHEKIFVLKNHPWILVVWALTCGGLLAVGLYGVVELANEQEKANIDAAKDLATETGVWFSNALDLALLPLFTLSQFVQQLDMFATLPEQIGVAFQPGSIPFLPPNEDGDYTHRNVTGSVCGDPSMVAKFAELASNIKKDAKMEGILVNLQVAPMATVCYLHPVNNTEDFEPPTFMDNTGAIGHDLLTDPQRKFIARVTVPSDDVVIAGPLTLRQCSDCDPTVQTAFIARMTIDALSEKQVIHIDGIDYKKWGFAVALINFAELVDRSEIGERFAIRGLRYQLTRTDKNYNAETKEFDVKVNMLAGDEDFDLDENFYVSIDLDTTNNLWNIKVGNDNGFVPSWKNGAVAATVTGALLLSFMFMIICIENQIRHDLLREMLPPKALRKIKKGQTCVEKYNVATVFFSDIVGYTAMSAEMSAIQVMKMLNEFYTEVDKIATKHKVCKIQTIGDAYMVTGGVPDRCLGPEGAKKVALFAIETIELAKDFRTSDGAKVVIRAGVNSGPLVAGVVGTKRPQYTVFGDTVNNAARMESTSEKMRIQCTDITYRLLRDSATHVFDIESRGGVEVKGNGIMNTWFINGATEKSKKHQSTLIEIEGSTDDNCGDIHLYDDL